MKFAVIGAGAVGGYYGGRLAQSGHSVTFVCRPQSATLNVLKKQGLTVKSILGDFTIPASSLAVTDDPSTVGPVDYILVATKAWQITALAQRLKPLFHNDTWCLSVANGIAAHKQLAEVLPVKNIGGGLTKIIAEQESPGVINHSSVHPSIEFGELSGELSSRFPWRGPALQAAFEACEGVDAVLSENVLVNMWSKFVFISSTSAIGALTRVPTVIWMNEPRTEHILDGVFEEGAMLAMACDEVDIGGEALLKDVKARLGKVGPKATMSLQRDMMEGRPSELNDQIGMIVKLAEEKGLRVPVSQLLYSLLLPQEAAARQP